MERALLVGVFIGRVPRREAEESIEELKVLSQSAGAEVVGEVLQHRDKINPKYYIGEGKLNEIKVMAKELNVDIIVFDDKLSPAQYKNLENKTNMKILDRSQLILDIFAQRARSIEGKLQVELAQLLYLLPRLVGKGIELSRLGGGIGTRGPGEKKLEYERRKIRDRISKIKKELKNIEKRRSLYREKRRKQPIPYVSLAGYTSAGKTTLFNMLTSEGAKVSSSLFSTLDPLTRIIELKNGLKFYLSDTVGFIKKLPVELVEAFKSTLDEIVYTDLIFHIIDYSRDDYQKQIDSVEKILSEIGASDKNIIKVYNKIDLITDGKKLIDKNSEKEVFVSASKGWGTDNLLTLLEKTVFSDFKLYKIKVKNRFKTFMEGINSWGFIVKKHLNGDEIIYEVYIKYEDMLKFLPKLKEKGEII